MDFQSFSSMFVLRVVLTELLERYTLWHADESPQFRINANDHEAEM